MATKSAEQRAIEKQIKANEKAQREAMIRDRASGIVGGARYINGFRVMDDESEALLKEILKQYNGNENNHVKLMVPGTRKKV